jgi:HSP20 family protein
MASNSNVTRWTPAASLFTPALSRFFDEAFEPFGARDDRMSTRSWAPPVDIKETPDALVLSAELPGIDKKDVHINIEENVLTISGERSFARDEKKEDYHRIERVYGSFSRSFTLPRNVKIDAVKAAFDNGVLTVTVPKAEESKPRKIAIG